MGMGRTDITEVIGTIFFLAAIQIPLAIYTIVYLLDINIKQDIIKRGLCKYQTIDAIDGGDSEEEVGNNMTQNKRCCLRYNYKVKIMLRRKMLAEQLQEENEQLRSESSRDSSEKSMFKIQDEDDNSSESDSSEEEQKQAPKGRSKKKVQKNRKDVEMRGLATAVIFAQGEMKHGKGEFTWPNGNTYVGDWEDDQMHGEGVLTRSDGRRYEGSFVAGKADGFGVQMWADGAIHAGTWKEGKQHGIGNYTANGKTKQGEWEDGARTKWIKDID